MVGGFGQFLDLLQASAHNLLVELLGDHAHLDASSPNKLDPTTFKIFLAFLFVLTLLIAVALSNLIYYLAFGKSVRNEAVLILGPCNSGKTKLFYLFRTGRIQQTVTSLEPNDQSFVPIFMRENKNSDEKGLKRIRIVDFPGHPRLRGDLETYLVSANKIIFLVGKDDAINIDEASELMYEVLEFIEKTNSKVKLLVACNLTAEMDCKRKLESQLSLLKTTRATMNDGSTSIGRKDQSFNFDLDCKFPTKFVKVDLDSSKITEIQDFLLQ